jgi:hypothetical protein
VTHAANPLVTVTYDGSGQATHPDVYDAGNAWNGYRYWMACTPYPAADLTKENPSILASNDKLTWEVPAGLTNPLYLPVDGSFNADPDLTMVGSTLWCIYKNDTATSIVYGQSSTDGVNWSAKVALFSGVPGFCLSPAIVHDGTQFIMFANNRTGTPGNYTYTLEKRTAATIDGVWSAPVAVNITPAANTYIWHLDVIRDGARLWCLLFNYGTTVFNTGLYLGYSDDWGDTWTLLSYPIIPLVNCAGTWAAGSLYRGSLVRTPTGFDLWYSGSTAANVWHIGYTPILWNG